MPEMAIVAIPDDRDKVWQISSQKIPHMTLLYLGEQKIDDRLLHVSDYLQHAVDSSLSRFGMTIERRGLLGPDDADVLFFEKNWVSKGLETFRQNLLKDTEIFTMWNSVEQYPEWTPHLTLGYPKSPAHEMTDENRPYWVEFDRIALWVDDFDGPTYLIPKDDDLAVAWSDTANGDELWHIDPVDELLRKSLDYVKELIEEDDSLRHYGVKGMKWGVRKKYDEFADKHHKGSPGALKTEVTTKTGEKISVVKEKPGPLALAVAKLTKRKPEDGLSAMAIVDSDGKKVGSFQAWKDRDYDNTIRGEWLVVDKEAQGRGYSKAAIDGLMKAAKEDSSIDNVRLQVPSDAAPAKHIYTQLGFKKDVDLGEGIEDWVADVSSKKVKHSESVEEFLLHYGVKGMKWGVRNDRGHEGERAKTKTIAKADKKYEKEYSGVKGWAKIQNAMAAKVNPGLEALNNSPKYKDKNLWEDKKAWDSYTKEYEKLIDDAANALNKEFGSNASGTKAIHVSREGTAENSIWRAEFKEIKHADDNVVFVVVPRFDKKGHIVQHSFVRPEEVEHEDLAGDFLSHYGVKGMKWGVTRTRAQIDAGVKKAKKAISDREELKKSDKARPVSSDAQRKAENLRIARNASIDRLDNKELQALVTRMNLENQYNSLTKGKNKSLETRATDFVKEFYGLAAKDAKNGNVLNALSTSFKNNKPDDWRKAF